MSETQTAEQAFEQGYLGEVPDPIENEAYTVSGQGADTAQREREALDQLRADRFTNSRDPEYGKTTRKSSRKSSGSTSSS